MDLIELNIDGISYSHNQTGAYALILSELNGERKLPIVIGGFEAQSIAIGLEKEITPLRPLTHDLFRNSLEIFNITIKQIIIHKLVDGVFFSSIVYEQNKIEEIIDARTSDAVSLAIRFKAPIYTYEFILSKAGFIEAKIKEKNNEKDENMIKDFVQKQTPKNPLPDDLSSVSEKKLINLLKKLVSTEEYEDAVRIRDEISKRKKKN
tara:strand:- start:650 stop:1270 length:621 start_codon:yes stop_codon:yes gene_type:complete